MTTALKLRRGTTAQHASFTGLEAEVTVDTTKDTLVVHDGATAGGHPLAKAADLAGYMPNTNPSYTGTLTGGTGVINIGSGQLYKDASGNIGVGTATPTSGYKMDVVGNFKVTGSIDENIFAVTGTTPALSPQNGTIQTWNLSGNSTPTVGTWNDGESMTLMVNDGTAFTISWASMSITWVGGTAPSLDTTKFTVIELWRVGSVIYGALVGAA